MSAHRIGGQRWDDAYPLLGLDYRAPVHAILWSEEDAARCVCGWGVCVAAGRSALLVALIRRHMDGAE